MKNLIALFIAITFMFSASLAQAEVVSFGDNVKYWEGFGNRYGDNRYDVIGNPDITGGNFIFSGHVLTGISINYTSTDRLLIPGDWFFDVNQDNKWDYVLHNDIPSYKNVGPYASTNSYSLYSVDFDFAIDSPLASWRRSSPYDESFAGWYGYREDHPVQANVDSSKYDFTLLQSISFTGWEYTGTGPYTSTWSGFGIDLTEFLGEEFTYGFAMTCANDVLFGSAPIPSPEPSTWILFGSGLGMLMLARRKRNDNSA
jgi:hypothetical protein